MNTVSRENSIENSLDETSFSSFKFISVQVIIKRARIIALSLPPICSKKKSLTLIRMKRSAPFFLNISSLCPSVEPATKEGSIMEYPLDKSSSDMASV